MTLRRVPDRGIQPQTMVGTDGRVHLIYYRGDGKGGDVYYTVSSDSGATFATPIRVNQQPNSAVAAGNVRGAQLALGRDGRPQIAWMGAQNAQPRGPGGATPMLYTRLAADGQAFEPERNVMQAAVGLDGGGTVAADGAGHVYVIWHATGEQKGEDHRRVWVARSDDDGATFAPETAVDPDGRGCCACCMIRAFADSAGTLYILYRSAGEMVHRDMWLMVSTDQGRTFRSEKLAEWNVGMCVMSTSTFWQSGPLVTLTWETLDQTYFGSLNPVTHALLGRHAAPGDPPSRRRYPVAVTNPGGETLFAWTEGMAWNQGGSLRWQVYDRDGRPTDERGRAPGVPTWSLVAAVPTADGFVILY